MPRWGDHQDDEDDDLVDAPDDEDDDGTIPCPYCRNSIHEDSERCPHCHTYISREDAPYARKPWWIILGVAACLYAMFRWMLF
jgi:hypothetical protein